MTRRESFTQSQVTKLLKGARAAGMAVRSLESSPDGTLILNMKETLDEAPVRDEWADAIREQAALTVDRMQVNCR